ncbi:hypothetical protein [Arcobacter peruensis]|uniref:hypothetical protein n=1 Tax=Arcobacter peruensis TaxID=2320140 RepID=UPI000F0929A6|nr:hypothetical protein [Arcobacter peruensis]
MGAYEKIKCDQTTNKALNMLAKFVNEEKNFYNLSREELKLMDKGFKAFEKATNIDYQGYRKEPLRDRVMVSIINLSNNGFQESIGATLEKRKKFISHMQYVIDTYKVS